MVAPQLRWALACQVSRDEAIADKPGSQWFFGICSAISECHGLAIRLPLFCHIQPRYWRRFLEHEVMSDLFANTLMTHPSLVNVSPLRADFYWGG